jgi:glycosyltransferase involved in cell wall biosynthesis
MNSTAFDPINNRWLAEPTLDALPKSPLVSVIVPSFNQGRYIRDTIHSILNQTYKNLEIIVVDGASSDETLQVLDTFADEPRLRVFSKPDKGVADAVNKGLHLARGQVGAIQSSDDVYLPDAVESGVKALSRESRPGIAYGDIIKVDAEGNELARIVTGGYSLEAWLTKQTYIPQPAAFFRLALIDKAGMWDPTFFNADTEFWLRLIWHAPVIKINQALALRRMHGEQRDTQSRKICESYARMMTTSSGIKTLPFRLRRAAAAGSLLHRIRYNPQPTALSNRILLWRALAIYPELFPKLQSRYRLVPYGAEILQWAGMVRRRIRAVRP